VLDNVTWTRGAHTIKFGVDLRRRQITEYQTNRGNGRFQLQHRLHRANRVVSPSGDSIASMLLGYPSLYEQDYLLVWPGIRGIESGTYIADDWRLSKKLTLNVRIFRWATSARYSEVCNALGNFDLASATIKVAGQNGVSSTAGVNGDWKGFRAPLRLCLPGAFSHRDFAADSACSTIRTGTAARCFVSTGTRRSAPSCQSARRSERGTSCQQGFPPTPTVNFDSLNNPSGSVIAIPGNLKQAYAEQFNLTLEQEFAPVSTLFKFAYVGNLGRRLGKRLQSQPTRAGPGAHLPRRAFYAIRPALGDITTMYPMVSATTMRFN